MAATSQCHSVLNDWAPIGLVNAALAEWPAPDWRHWHSYYDANAVKRASKDASRIPRAASLLIERMAEIEMGESFPDLELHGAGLHEIPDGGHLAKHLDGAKHPQAGWARAANAVLFLNDDFRGGELVFHASGQFVEPKKNRLVIFQTSDEEWHSVNQVSGGSRKTLSLFWWTLGPVESDRTCAEFSE